MPGSAARERFTCADTLSRVDLYLFTSTLLTMLVIVDPPGLLPVFLGLTRRQTIKQRRSTALVASCVALATTVVFAIFGRNILDYLGVSIPSLQVSGGLLLLLVALDLLQGKLTADDQEASGTNVAVVPLGTPLMAGPGTIVAAMVAMDSARNAPLQLAAVIAAIIVTMVITWLCLHFSTGLHRILREAGTTLASRIAGMLLAAIAVQMIATGVFQLIRGAKLI